MSYFWPRGNVKIKKKTNLCKIHNNNFKGEDFIVERTKAAAADTLLYVLNAAQLKASRLAPLDICNRTAPSGGDLRN